MNVDVKSASANTAFITEAPSLIEQEILIQIVFFGHEVEISKNIFLYNQLYDNVIYQPSSAVKCLLGVG